MKELHLPWLEATIFVPLIGALICAFISNRRMAQQVAMVASALTMCCALCEWYDFWSLHTFEAHDHWDLVQWLTDQNIFVIDELNAPLLPLTALLYLMTIVSTLHTKLGRFSFGLTLVSEALTLGTLCCHEPWALITLLSLACIPPWLELKRRDAPMRVFSLHIGAFIFMLNLGWSMVDRYAGVGSAAFIPAILLTFATLLRAGIFPLHLWLTDLFEHATFGTALLFVAPMTGAYAVMHLVLPFAPTWAMQCISVLSLITALYAAAMATVQVDARRFYSFLFLSHSSLVLTGMEFVTTIGLTGALCVWLSVGLSLGGFGLTLRSIESRIGRVRLDQFHGLYDHTPTLAGLFLLTGLASIGFPGTVGFVAMELLVEGAVDTFPLAGVAVVVAAALNGIAIVRAYCLIFTGGQFRTTAVLRSRPAERFAVIVLSVLILGGGLWPQPGVSSRHHAAESLMKEREMTLNTEAWEELDEADDDSDDDADDMPDNMAPSEAEEPIETEKDDPEDSEQAVLDHHPESGPAASWLTGTVDVKGNEDGKLDWKIRGDPRRNQVGDLSSVIPV